MATFTGTVGNDKVVGTSGNDLINGLAGNDTLIGGAGSDTLYGGAGADYLYGGAGNDTFKFNHANSTGWTELNGGATIMDFQGAGLPNAPGVDNDFIALNGYGTAATGAHLDFFGVSAKMPSLQYYKVYADAAHGGGFSWLSVKMADHETNHLSAAYDYQFYAS
ncbi:hypothetical protein [Roseicella sp. DB1501]|uniref:hypothetical protein n=1 Tax=Roseicella sp. DB1501 TaxID=2730925 RepID=UPI001492E503|nr:hypothetical protein [Roseicella sp. DB1501]NOG74148.1 hypothetical protein [Roseicella sp. DB1501]